MIQVACVVLFLLPAAAQRYVSFDRASASSLYSPTAFAAELATTDSSGYWCSSGGHAPGATVAWTGSMNTRRALFGIAVRWSYAPAEVKVLASADGGNFEEAAGWRTLERQEPSFEEAIMFPRQTTAKAITILMRGPKPWGYFGIASVAAISGPYSFMLVNGRAGAQEQCLVSTDIGVAMQPCLSAIVAGSGAEIFEHSDAGQIKLSGGKCLALLGSQLGLEDCDGRRSAWEITQDGQVKRGSVCLAASAGMQVAAADCDAAAAEGADKFFQVAVPSHDTRAAVAVRSMGVLLRAAVDRQAKLLAALQRAVPKLEKCKVASLAQVGHHAGSAKALLAKQGFQAPELRTAADVAVGMIAGHFGAAGADFARVVAATSDVLASAAAKSR